MKNIHPLLLTFMIGSCTSINTSAQSTKNDPSIISPDSKVELIKNGFTNLEGSSVSHEGIIYFVELFHTRIDPFEPAKIWSYNPNTGDFNLFISPSGRTAGTEFDSYGNLICAEFTDGGGRRITRRNVHTKDAKFLATGYEGKLFNGPNDLTIDENNRIYFTDYSYTIGTESLYHRFGGVYRIDSIGKVIRVIDNAGKPNGIAVSPDQKTLYVGTNGYDIWNNQGILSYDLNDDGSVDFRSILVDFKTDLTLDGLTVDINGNIYASIVRGTQGTGVRVYSPNGDELAFLQTPTGIQNLTFGKNEYLSTLFMVGQNSMYKVKLETNGYHLTPK